MFLIKISIFYLMMFTVADETRALVKLHGGDSRIKRTQAVIRTANKLFSSLKIRGLRDRPRLKQIYNNFISLMLQDHRAVKRIVKISKVDKTTYDNGTENFVDLINEILNTDSNATSAEQNDNSTVVAIVTRNLVNYIDDYLQRLIYYQNLPTHPPEIKEEHFRSLNGTDALTNNFVSTNYTVDDDDLITNESEKFWVPDENYRRIYNGKKTRVQVFPFVVSVQILGKFHCGGSIIGDDLIITAASCLQLAYNERFFRENPAFLAVRVGSNYFTHGGELIGILEVYFHPDYTPRTLQNNLAIVRLERRIRFSKKIHRVKKIEIDKHEGCLPETTNGITIVGWGANRASNIINDPLMRGITYTTVDIYPFDECKEIYSDKFVTRRMNFCAGFLTVGSGACNHDVGGPGVVSGYLTGVISFGSPICGSPNAPTVFTKLGAYYEWIYSILTQPDVIQAPKKTTIHTTSTAHPDEPTKPPRFKPLRMKEQDKDKISEDILDTLFDSSDAEKLTNLFENDDGDDFLASLEGKTTQKSHDILFRDRDETDFDDDEQVFLSDESESIEEEPIRKPPTVPIKRPVTFKSQKTVRTDIKYTSLAYDLFAQLTKATLNPDEAELKLERNIFELATSGLDKLYTPMTYAVTKPPYQLTTTRQAKDKLLIGFTDFYDDDISDKDLISDKDFISDKDQNILRTKNGAKNKMDPNDYNDYKEFLPKESPRITQLTKYLQYRNKKISNTAIRINSKEDDVTIPKVLLFQLLSEVLEANKNKNKPKKYL